jgi:hypothetical protein
MLTPSARDVFGAAVDAERISDAMLSVAFGLLPSEFPCMDENMAMAD